ncbi:ATX1 antioxidant protein 1 [Lobulomyces angularis]|nr:ATX1 antioxidant protein 1 [Lobulomyces angularis]
MTEYKYTVAMTCSGCSGAVERVLKKEPKISNFKVDLETQLVTVESDSLTNDEVFNIIKKSGKETKVAA